MAERGGVLRENLNHNPKAKNDHGWELNRGEDKAKENEIADSVFGKHDQISSQDSGNRPRSSERWNRRVGIDENLAKRCHDTAAQVKDEKLQVSEVVFDIVTEDPQIKH